MPKNTQIAAAVASAQADALARALDDGYLRIYAGTQPATADTAITNQTLLVELRFAAVSAPAASDGVLTFSALLAASALSTGIATWFRCLSSDGTTVIFDGTVGTSVDGANLTLNTTSITAGGLIGVSAASYTVATSSTGY